MTMTETKINTPAVNLREHFEALETAGICVGEFFKVPGTPFKERIVRIGAPKIAHYLPSAVRFRLTSLAKRLRNPDRRLHLNYPLDFTETRQLAQALGSKDLSPWWGRKAAVCLCHDVDDEPGMGHVASIMEADRRGAVRSSFNFLTHGDYDLDLSLLCELRQQGFEIGLHGFNHDQGFAFREKSMMLGQLRAAMGKLAQFCVQGFRSPALSLSDDMFHALKASGITYDSSLQTASPFYYSVRLPYPVYLEDYGIWELPLTVQDDNYLRDAQVTLDEMLSSLARFIDETVRLNGVFVFNVHPHNMIGRREVYKEILALLASRKDVAVKTMGEVIRYAQGHPDHQ
jgi:hypothetical protein